MLEFTTTTSRTNTFDRLESEVRGYCRSFPTVFTQASGSILRDEDGNEYVDFFAGAGTLNYGHNEPGMKQALVNYLLQDGVTHSLDMHSAAKRRFLEALEQHILAPREMMYKMQFTGPTGTNAVEAAFKLARKVTGRTNIVSFTNGFHGVTTGSVAATGNNHFRQGLGVPRQNTTFMPYEGYLGIDVDSLAFFEKMLLDSGSGLDKPAAVIVETVQGEGGVNVASFEWLRRLESICRQNDLLLIVDDIQVGCGRTGRFFSFEEAGISPDIVTLSKSLSGYGLPFALVLIRPDLDVWKPGEHNGTFRGNNLAFVAAAKAIETYWFSRSFSDAVRVKSGKLGGRLRELSSRYPNVMRVRGRGLIFGVEFMPAELADAVAKAAFERGLLVETCGSTAQVVKFLPPLNTPDDIMDRGMDLFEGSVEAVLESFSGSTRQAEEV